MNRLLLLLSLVLSLASAKCMPHNRLKRQAWHTLKPHQKTAYITAELCLMHKPATLSLPGSTSRHEDLQAAHQLQSYRVHNVGAFLPFHRALLSAHEVALRTECKYEGAQPYWAEELDAGNFLASTTYQDFGGDGGVGGCVDKGPFANKTNHLGPGYGYTTHCINRERSEFFSNFSSQVNLDECLREKTWLRHWNCTENLPHLGGHGGVGGLMLDPISSPGDPLFYLHHTWLDKIWADWQRKDLPKRLKEMGGNNVQDEPNLPPNFPPRPPGVPLPTGADGDPSNITTLHHVLNLYGNGPNRTISDVMDIWDGVLCYEYKDY